MEYEISNITATKEAMKAYGFLAYLNRHITGIMKLMRDDQYARIIIRIGDEFIYDENELEKDDGT